MLIKKIVELNPMTKQKHFYLIRGLIREKAHWGNFLSFLQEEHPGARLTTIDIPGAGVYWKEPSPSSIRGMVEQMRRDYLAARTEGEDARLVAISLGGMIGVEWMKHHPTDFTKATFINTSFGGISPVYQRLMPPAFLYLLKVPILKGREKEGHILKLVSNHEDKFHTTLDLWDDIQKERPVSLRNTLTQLLAGAGFRIGNFTPPVPVTILASTNDRMVSVECSRAIARKWKLPIAEHPTGGHDLTVDDPKWVAEKIRELCP